MSPIREVCLSLTEVDDLIRSLEQKHGILSSDLLLDADLRGRLPEDDVFEWEACLAHKRELERNEQVLHTGYLNNVRQASEDAPGSVPSQRKNNNLALAA